MADWTEIERLANLRRYEILDTPVEAEFDDIVQIASHVCEAPIALISLVDSERQWFKATVGLDVRETPISQSICAQAILQDDIFIIPDTTKDERTNTNILVTGAPDLRFYAGAVLKSADGLPLGMVCVLDTKPRVLTEKQARTLKALAHQVMLMLDMKIAIKAKQADEQKLRHALEDTKSQNARLKLLARVSDRLFHKEDLDEGLREIFLAVQYETRSEMYFNYVAHNERPDYLTLNAASGLSDAQREYFHVMDPKTFLCSKVAKTGKPVILEDLQAQGDALSAGLRKLGVQAYAGFPLAARSSLLGTLTFCSTKRKTFEGGELELMHTVAAQISTAMDRVKLLRELTDRESDLRFMLDRAESANSAKSEFLANMSHEIRTPMNAVVGLTNILERTGPLTARQKEFIATLKLSADSLLVLINDMLDIAKIEAGSVDLEVIPFSLKGVAEDVVSIMAQRAREKHLSIVIDDSLLAENEFIGDPARLKQILMNLCSNAIKFTQTGGVKVILSSERLSRGLYTVSMNVDDTGIGISEKTRSQIFEKFVQADSSISRQYGGSGLGLAIVKTLVELMKGQISVTSEVGKGASFVVKIPMHKATEGADKLVSPIEFVASADTTQHRVLLVEDYPANVLVAGSFLEHFGYSYDVATDGFAALEKLETGRYVAVLMDVQMHGLNGYEATKKIRERERRDTAPHQHVIGMTANAMAGDRELCLDAGMDDYISKPFRPDDLEQKLALAVARLAGPVAKRA